MSDADLPVLSLLTKQRSHLLLLLGNAAPDCEQPYQKWCQRDLRHFLQQQPQVLSIELMQQHKIDVCLGEYPRLPYRYLSIIELSLDGAEQAGPLIAALQDLQQQEDSAGNMASWLYYPVSEKVGRDAVAGRNKKTLAFANAKPGTENEFREWYATRHIRHAMQVPALVSGQCFQRTGYQQPGDSPADFSIIAVYEQEGTPEEMIACFESLPEEALDFPDLDLNPGRFAEWVYQQLPAAD